MNVFVFDIETVPDVAAGRRIMPFTEDPAQLTDAAVAEAMMHRRRQQTGSDFLKLHLHKVVAISAVLRTPDSIKVWSLGSEESDEAELIQRFFTGVERFSPTLVSWNGSGFDLPVLHYRAMLHNISAPRYWEQGDTERDFRFNNYISRYHNRHTDVMDILALYQARAYVPLDEMASLLGYPGKMGMSGGKVWDSFRQGELKAIRDYCETDVLNTYLVYLRFQILRGQLSHEAYRQEETLLREYLQHEGHPHFLQFLDAWPQPAD